MLAVVPAADPWVVITRVSGRTGWPEPNWLNVHVAPAGSPEQENVTNVGWGVTPVASTVKLYIAGLPAETVTLLGPVGVITIGGPTCVGSLAVWLFASPPPETVAELVTLAWIFCGTFTVKVIAG